MLRPLLPSVALCPLLFACAEPAPPSPARERPDPVRTVRAPARDIAPTPPPPKIERDPYDSYLARADGDGALGKTALERIPLDRLRLVGIVEQAAPLALLEDDGGHGHVVRIGTRVGTEGGTVKRIERGRLVVEERFYDPAHRVIPVEKTLSLGPARG